MSKLCFWAEKAQSAICTPPYGTESRTWDMAESYYKCHMQSVSVGYRPRATAIIKVKPQLTPSTAAHELRAHVGPSNGAGETYAELPTTSNSISLHLTPSHQPSAHEHYVRPSTLIRWAVMLFRAAQLLSAGAVWFREGFLMPWHVAQTSTFLYRLFTTEPSSARPLDTAVDTHRQAWVAR